MLSCLSQCRGCFDSLFLYLLAWENPELSADDEELHEWKFRQLTFLPIWGPGLATFSTSTEQPV